MVNGSIKSLRQGEIAELNLYPYDTAEEFADTIQESIKPEFEDTFGNNPSVLMQRLKALPFIGTREIGSLRFKWESDTFPDELYIIETEKVIGTVNTATHWGNDYVTRPNRTINVARQLLNADPEVIEYIFHVQQNKSSRVKLLKIDAPLGPFYIAWDGTHRISGAKLIQLPVILATVVNAHVNMAITDDYYRVLYWQRLIKRGD